MNRILPITLMITTIPISALAATEALTPDTDGKVLWERFLQTRKDAQWREVPEQPISFRTFHPQGMTAAGDRFYLSSVEVVDRKADKGVGHLFEMDRKGTLLRELILGDGAMYHPGGIDFDGRQIWVPVAAYHPDSSAVVYTVEPEKFQPREVFRFNDHLGALAHFPERRVLVGVNWGSRRFYRWKSEEHGEEWTVPDPEHPECFANGCQYIDYQDVQRIAGTPFLLCSGLQSYAVPGERLRALTLGGIDMVDVEQMCPRHQLPVPLRPAMFPAWTQNPFYVEPCDGGLRFYFIPEDGRSSIHVFEVDTVK